MTRLLFASLLVGCWFCTGCAAPTRHNHQQRVIRGASTDAVLAEAAVVLQREFGRLQVDPVTHRIVTQPVEFTTQRSSGTARDLYGGRSTMRRKATFTVVDQDDSPVARLRIDVERRDTVRRAIMQPRSHRISDAPGHETPIDRDAATTHEQNTVWTQVRRDTKLERALLEELRERLERQTGEPTDNE